MKCCEQIIVIARRADTKQGWTEVKICKDFALIYFGLHVAVYVFMFVQMGGCVRVNCVCVREWVCVWSFVLNVSYQSFSNALQPVLKHVSCLNSPSSLTLCASHTFTETMQHAQRCSTREITVAVCRCYCTSSRCVNSIAHANTQILIIPTQFPLLLWGWDNQEVQKYKNHGHREYENFQEFRITTQATNMALHSM